MLQKAFPVVPFNLLLLKCSVCIFPLNKMGLNVFKSKPEMSKKHTAFNKHDELKSTLSILVALVSLLTLGTEFMLLKV